MKKMKKMIALMIAMVMVIGTMSMTAFAADGDLVSDTPIQVEDLTVGDVVTYYQVIEWKDGNWAFKAPFDTLSDADLTEIIGTPAVPDDPTTPEDESQEAVAGKITQAMATKIAEAATSGGTTDPALTTTTWTKANPAAGLYMIVVAAKESGVVYNPAFVGADFDDKNDTNIISITATYSDTAVAKKTNIITKKTESDTDEAIKQAINSKVGEEITFNVETTIPVFMPTFTKPSFEVKDTITTGGVKLDPDTIKVTLTPAAEGTVYQIKDTSDTGFTIVFNEAYLKSNKTSVKVEVEYKGILTNKADFNINREENTVDVTYSNGPGEEKGAMKDLTNVYTFSLGAALLGDKEKKTSEIVKVGVDENGEYITELVELDNEKKVGALPGAQFGLYTDSECKTLYTNDLTDGLFTTGADGVITYKGLAEGTYYLKEISAPAGYIKDQNPHTVVIEAKYNDPVNYTETVNGISVTYDIVTLKSYSVTVDGQKNTYEIVNDGPKEVSTTINKESFEVQNTKGRELPSTGGIGTTLFYVAGSVLVIGAAVLLISKRRMGTR